MLRPNMRILLFSATVDPSFLVSLPPPFADFFPISPQIYAHSMYFFNLYTDASSDSTLIKVLLSPLRRELFFEIAT